ncbi:MAG: hypothetical protein M1820_006559 [Bogoriella megaspora]|nr:MAG: hypothetical protein M1820_006559 [Bogoriella megaspora]
MRLNYIPEDFKTDDPEDEAIVSRVKERRGGKLLELDRTLLHAPPVADGWNSFLLSIRTKTTLSTSIRESAICRVAILNKAFYEWDHHLPILLSDPSFPPLGADYILKTPPGKAGQPLTSLETASPSSVPQQSETIPGSTGSKTVDSIVDSIAQATSSLLSSQSLTPAAPVIEQQRESHVLDDKHLAVLAYTDSMTLSVSVPEAVFASLKQHFNEREIVEITATIAAYNCVSRFLVALDVGERVEKGMTSEGGGGQVE